MSGARPRSGFGRAPCALAALALLGLAGLAQAARAHETGLSSLRLRAEGRALEVELELGLGDAAAALGLPGPRERDPAADPGPAREGLWLEVEPRTGELERRVRRSLAFWQDGTPCPLAQTPARLEPLLETGSSLLRFRALCPTTLTRLELSWTLPFERDPLHRALVSLSAGDATQSVILSARLQRVELELQTHGARAALASYLVEGVRHIASGPDHLLFLIALLLPAPLLWDGRGWSPRPGARRVLIDVVQIVTAFTLAHSVTLALCVLGALALPARAVESAIAASVAIAALNGIRPFLPGRSWQIAFAFGLLHGLGFAGSLRALGLPPFARGLALLGFNLGVELGQLVVVAACLPLLLALGRRSFYRSLLLPGACAAIAALAALWLVERLGGWTLLGLE